MWREGGVGGQGTARLPSFLPFLPFLSFLCSSLIPVPFLLASCSLCSDARVAPFVASDRLLVRPVRPVRSFLFLLPCLPETPRDFKTTQTIPDTPCMAYSPTLTPDFNHPWPFLGSPMPVPWSVWACYIRSSARCRPVQGTEVSDDDVVERQHLRPCCQPGHGRGLAHGTLRCNWETLYGCWPPI